MMLQSQALRFSAVSMALACVAMLASLAKADELPPEEQTFFDKNISNVVHIQPARISSPALLKVFAAPFYAVKVEIRGSNGTSVTNDLVVARVDEKLTSVDRPSSDSPLPSFPKMLVADYKLKTDADAKAMQDAMDVIYPIFGDDDKKVEGFKRVGDLWVFMRGAFFADKMGFVFETDADGVIKSAKYMLKLP
jgi:hypothetical protein